VFLLQYGFHPGTTGVHFEAAARRRTDEWDVHPMAYAQSLPLRDAPYEGSFLVDSGIRVFQRQAAAAPFPTAAYFIDVHLHLPSYLALAGLFDHVFVAQPDHLQAFQATHPSAAWLPLACPAEFVTARREPEFEVGFVGNVGPGSPRETVLLHLEKHFVMNDWRRSYTTEEMGDVYRRSAVVVNVPIRDDVNMRFFEAMGAGAAVVTPRLGNGLPALADEGRHYAVADFDSVDDITAVVTSLLRSGQAEVIGGAARDLVAERHTYDHRLQAVVDSFAQHGSAPIRTMSRRERARYLGTAANATASASLAREAIWTARGVDIAVWKNVGLASARAARRRALTRAVRRSIRAAHK
jgi:hypothetical protein